MDNLTVIKSYPQQQPYTHSSTDRTFSKMGTRMEGFERVQKTSECGRFVHEFNYGDDFIGAYICQNL